MRPLASAVRAVGHKSIGLFLALYEALYFTVACVVRMLLPRSYNPAMRSVLIKQIYFTAVQPLPIFILAGMLFGSAIVGYIIHVAVTYALQAEIGTILVAFVMHEFVPFFTIMLVALRSGAAINTEIAVMQVNGELHTLRAYRIDPVTYLFLPRIIGVMISTVLIAAGFTVIMFAGGYLFIALFLHMNIDLYTQTIIRALEVGDVFILIGKSAAFSFFATMIPIYSGLQCGNAVTDIPIAVLHGMIRLFISIFVIEVFSLMLKSL